MNSLHRLTLSLGISRLLWVPAVSSSLRGCTSKTERFIEKIGRQSWRAYTLLSLLTIGVNVGLATRDGLPLPIWHDEFSYLLAADTFAHGRLTNPTHPLWPHFESFHIIHQPSYASKYPPAQALIQALGQMLTGYPITGVWLIAAFVACSIYWMLRAWMPARWAFVGGLMAIFHPSIFGWSQSYMGGGIAMAGGALLLGAARRLMKRPCTNDAWLLGIGLTILALSRPFEGMIFALLIGAGMLYWIKKTLTLHLREIIRKTALPLVITLSFTFTAIGYYNHSITGRPLTIPYLIHESTYAVTPLFLFQPLQPVPIYRHVALKEFHTTWSADIYRQQHSSLGGLLRGVLDKVGIYSLGYFGFPPFLLSLLALPSIWRHSQVIQWAMVILVMFIAVLMIETFVMTHYGAPAFGLVFVTTIQGMRYLRCHPLGRPIMVVVIIMSLCSLLMASAEESKRKTSLKFAVHRAQLMRDLEHCPDKHLILVRYHPDHNTHHEYVYNQADIDNAKVVWGREMDATQNTKVLTYFSERTVWLLEEVKKDHYQLSPYPKSSESEAQQ